MDFLQAPLVRALLDETIPFAEVMNAFDIQTHIAFNLSSACQGFVYCSSASNKYLIVLNGNINFEKQCHVFVHEVAHIVKHMPVETYFIGIDMQRSKFEEEIDVYRPQKLLL